MLKNQYVISILRKCFLVCALGENVSIHASRLTGFDALLIDRVVYYKFTVIL